MMRLRWWLWHRLVKVPGVCPAKAHGALIWRTDRSVRIDGMCRADAARTGCCWCGKIGVNRPAVKS